MKTALSLHTLAMAEADYRVNDRDNNRIKDYWTADITGLYQGGLNLIRRELAEADAAPLNLRVTQPVPFHGYYFVALRRDDSNEDSIEYRQDTDKSGAKVHNFIRFGFCAYPAKYDWRHQRTFIINEHKWVFSVDNGGKPLTVWPPDSEIEERFGYPPVWANPR